VINAFNRDLPSINLPSNKSPATCCRSATREQKDCDWI
jgi:hypothetical protein